MANKFVVQSDPKSGRAPYIAANLPLFVETHGGEYFFIPSITALRMMAMGSDRPDLNSSPRRAARMPDGATWRWPLGPSTGQRVFGWLKGHMDLMFRIARTLVPILVVRFQGRTWALVTRYDDVQEVLTRPNVFDVTYTPKIATIMDGDNIFLGMKDEERFTRDKTNMRMTAPRGEAVARIAPETARLTAEVIDRARPAGWLDLAMELSQDVTTRLFGGYFGVAGRSVQGILRPGARAVRLHVRRSLRRPGAAGGGGAAGRRHARLCRGSDRRAEAGARRA